MEGTLAQQEADHVQPCRARVAGERQRIGAKADVAGESYQSGAMGRWELDYRALCAVNRRSVMQRMPSFRPNRAVQAQAGVQHRRWGNERAGAIYRPGPALGEHNESVYSVRPGYDAQKGTDLEEQGLI